MAKSSTSFGKDNQPNNTRGKSVRTKILESFDRMSKTEDEFFDLLTAKAFDPEDSFSFKELLSRMAPIPKAVNPLYQFDFDKDGTTHQQALQVVAAMAGGKIPSDIGATFINGLQSMLKIQEVTDIEERLQAIESIAKNGE